MTAALELRGLELHYKRFTLGPLDLRLEPGKVVGLVGPNGAGKTTTLRCIAGNLYADAGLVTVFGRESALGSGSWKEIIGYVPDKPEFFEHMTGERFLSFMSHYYSRWSHSLAGTLTTRFKVDLNTKVKHLSAGNRVKLSLVAALAHRPSLALFDEPTAGIDPVVRSEIFDVLWEMMESGEMTVLYSTHIVEDLHRLADEIVFLTDGKIRLHTPKDDLLDKWLRIRIPMAGELPDLESLVAWRRNGSEYVLTSSDGRKTLTSLTRHGIAGVRTESLSLEEIAVNIMKESQTCSA